MPTTISHLPMEDKCGVWSSIMENGVSYFAALENIWVDFWTHRNCDSKLSTHDSEHEKKCGKLLMLIPGHGQYTPAPNCVHSIWIYAWINCVCERMVADKTKVVEMAAVQLAPGRCSNAQSSGRIRTHSDIKQKSSDTNFGYGRKKVGEHFHRMVGICISSFYVETDVPAMA